MAASTADIVIADIRTLRVLKYDGYEEEHDVVIEYDSLDEHTPCAITNDSSLVIAGIRGFRIGI